MTTTTTKRIPAEELLASKPAWAKAALIATYEVDKSDSMTDYFATSTEKVVFLGWSKHTKDLFSEMRKAAALFSETAHLGPGKDVYHATVVALSDIKTGGSAIWKGSASPWHTDLVDRYNGEGNFATLAEAEAFIAAKGKPHDIGFGGEVASFDWKISKTSIEHREKYSMGAGYYLKASGRYSSGWTVEKTGTTFSGFVTVVDAPPPRPAAAPASTAVDAPKMIINTAKNGVELVFPSKPSDDVRSDLKANGWRWSRFNGLWYHRDSPSARAYAEAIVNVVSTP